MEEPDPTLPSDTYLLDWDDVRHWGKLFVRGSLEGHARICLLRLALVNSRKHDEKQQTLVRNLIGYDSSSLLDVHPFLQDQKTIKVERQYQQAKTLFCLCGGLAAAATRDDDVAQLFTFRAFDFLLTWLMFDLTTREDTIMCGLLFSGIIPAALKHFRSDRKIAVCFLKIAIVFVKHPANTFHRESTPENVKFFCSAILTIADTCAARDTEILLYTFAGKAYEQNEWKPYMLKFKSFMRDKFVIVEAFFDNEEYKNLNYEALQNFAHDAAYQAIKWRRNWSPNGIFSQPTFMSTCPYHIGVQALLLRSSRVQLWRQIDAENELQALEGRLNAHYLQQETQNDETNIETEEQERTNFAELIANRVAPFLAAFCPMADVPDHISFFHDPDIQMTSSDDESDETNLFAV